MSLSGERGRLAFNQFVQQSHAGAEVSIGQSDLFRTLAPVHDRFHNRTRVEFDLAAVIGRNPLVPRTVIRIQHPARNRGAERRRASVMPEACFQHDPPPGHGNLVEACATLGRFSGLAGIKCPAPVEGRRTAARRGAACRVLGQVGSYIGRGGALTPSAGTGAVRISGFSRSRFWGVPETPRAWAS